MHAEAPSAAATDWAQIVGLYDVLLRAEPSPVVELNRAVAVAMRDGPPRGWPWWTPSSRAASWPTTTWPTPRAPTCAGGSAERRGAGSLPRALALAGRSPSGGSSSGGSPSWSELRGDATK